jgi:enamine deaminase RidA (YjgF/YER057c/UK114 family)
MHTVLQPEGWAKPKGYANGIAARGRLVFLAGQIGWNAQGVFETSDFNGQVRQALNNIVTLLAEAGAKPGHIVSMTWYILDKAEYLESAKALGQTWREIMGRHYPAMAVVQVLGLVDEGAKVEIQAQAVVPE